MHNISTLNWITTSLVIVALFVLDYVVVERKPHAFSHKEAVRWVLFYVVAALVFAGYVWMYFGADYGQEFLAGWITEYSLSVDNLFVFIVLMSSFSVPSKYKHKVLLMGVAIAIVLRGLLIAVGAKAIEQFQGTFFMFAVFLGYTALHIWKSGEEEPDPDGNALVRFMEKKFNFTREYQESSLWVRQSGKLTFTPMFLVIIAVGTTDLLFALDSIPAIFGLTKHAYLVFTANAFALMGLRQLFFLLDGLLSKIIYLSKGLAIILGFIAVKLFLEAGHGVFHWEFGHVTIAQSLGFIVTTLAITVYVSLRAVMRNPSLAHTSEMSQTLTDAKRESGHAIDEMRHDTK
jgi:tellurite resistance protein TerC